MFKKTEEGRKFQNSHFRSNVWTLKLQKVDGCNCTWCSLLLKNQEESIACQCFIPPRHALTKNKDLFIGEPVLTTEIDLKEEHCPSKVKKLGFNLNTSYVIRKNLVRFRIPCNVCFKHMAIFVFAALTKVEKDHLKEHVKACAHQCGHPIFPNSNVEIIDLNFGSNMLETNHKIICKDKIETQIDHIYPSCVHCGKEDIILDAPKGYRPTCEASL